MKPIGIKDLCDVKMLSSLDVSPDGKTAVFCVTNADLGKNGYDSFLWSLDLKTGAKRKLTGGGKEKSFAWNGDKSIVYPDVNEERARKLAENGEELTVFTSLDLETGETREALRIPATVLSVEKLEKDMWLVTHVTDVTRPNFAAMKGAARAKALAEYKAEKDFTVCEELPFWFNGMGFINGKRTSLSLFDAKKGKLTPITEPKFTAHSGSVTSCKKYVLYTGYVMDKKQELTEGLYLYDVQAKTAKTLIEPGRYSIARAEFCGDTLIVAAQDYEKGYNAVSPKLYTYSAQTGKLTLALDLDEDLGCSTGTDCRFGGGKQFAVCGDELYFVTSFEHTSGVSMWKPGQKETVKLTNPEIGVDFFAKSGDTLLTVGFTGARLAEIYATDIKTGAVKCLTDINANTFAGQYVAEPKKLSFTNKDGVRIDGWVLEPINYDPKKKYPGVLEIHGGPRASFMTAFFHEMQIMASAGCFVFYCNPRGGSSRGNAFADIAGQYGTIDYDDLMAFTDVVLKEYPALDGKRLGVTGGSYGGFMTNWIIGHTDRFAAAVTCRSIASWTGFAMVSDIGPYFATHEMQSSPWNNNDKMWWHSPLKYADNFKTPTLVIHSFEDYRCWVPEGLQMYAALMEKDVDTRMWLCRGENHELSRSGKPKNRVSRLEEMTGWLYKYIKP